MRSFLYAAITLVLFLTATGASSQERRFGLGIIIGEPTGLSAKLWTSNRTALDFGLGWSLGGDRISKYDGYYTGESRIHFHMDHLWHSFDAIRSSERFPLYYGVGGRINTGAGYKNSAAVRGVLGILWLPRRTPIDVFLELVPALQLVPSTGFGIDAGIGVRYFF
ncbi:MAG: hypothetical protein A2509_06000 [Candidatus Edwardsbacteria bacterium RIFOXYD12_FULL_50_11]|uniref:DUF3996 domain-containing protein n=1 Tax=Candidatus Edwardsbacteria bacterium GWF2_54_11 TaxID=1817851 RepID=A0A1F5R0Q0_9BACT|nr:MAG: hypothetical protein A2502_10615 [Candidatus Edwardsbacteria bacterium RifOxyC12_full_54_24]OGF06718.1 MAG: hypothetical protein A2273_00450 [Candidatus Edwardsbacteria bacterium RifOxyA12_full_54_48]OGF08058.1 MAG: hypothetical protein A2024_02015 [Candidatus Edwardsbacteria bacterium GWF2_54_11]OGF10669.1 MAG: hypothetical protein A3K15_05815 [Candidatus Edwardsbacteria bacterium GWE2_54_12]OGF15450.1 MAG: hypothetical protein A2509_06000 [Candidatus Edwardsbacteria bacterium RIFOXYD1